MNRTPEGKVPKKTLIVPGHGDPCPRCHRPTQIREHRTVTDKQLNQPFYYSRWFKCTDPECRTGLVMPERYKVHRADMVIWGDTWANEGSQVTRIRPKQEGSPELTASSTDCPGLGTESKL